MSGTGRRHDESRSGPVLLDTTRRIGRPWPFRPFLYGSIVAALAAASLPFLALPAQAAPTTVTLTAVVNQDGNSNGGPQWSTHNVSSATEGATVTFTATVAGTITPATGDISWVVNGPGLHTCATAPLSGGTATCKVYGVQFSGTHSYIVSATYLPGNDDPANGSKKITITQPTQFPFSSGTPTTPPFTECPDVGNNFSGCKLLIVFNPDGTATILNNPKLGPYDGFDDTTVGVLNNGTTPVTSALLSSVAAGFPIFKFDGDGICSASNNNAGKNFAFTWSLGGMQLTPQATGCPYGPTTYEGPFISFSNYSVANNFETGTVTFTGPGGLAPGGTGFFNLEGPLTTLDVVPKPVAPTLTTPHLSSVPPGQPNFDTATVTGTAGGGAPTGTVTFYECGPGVSTCTSAGGTSLGSVALIPGANDTSTAASPPFSPSASGQWCFAAYYGGDANYAGSHDTSNGECFSAARLTSTTATAPAQSTVIIGQSTSDGATVTGNATGGSPTGSVNFFTCGPNVATCTSAGTHLGSVALTPGANNTAGASSPAFTPNALGTWCFAAYYSGDTSYALSHDTSAAECFTVIAKPAPATVTAPAHATVALGQSNTDSATVTGTSGGGSPTGTVTFFVCGPNASACSSSGTSLGSVALTAGANNTSGAHSAAFTASSPGKWCFAAVYGGDANYAGSQDTSATECFTIATVTSATATTPSQTTLTLGQSNTDTATVSGSAAGGAPTGSVTFFVCGPAVTSCSSSGTNLGAVALTTGANNTSSSVSAAFVPTAVGTWCFAATYAGGSTYGPSQDVSATECFTVIPKPDASIVTAPQQATITLGQSNSDGATVTGNPAGGSPTGSVTFYACGPAVTSCTSATGTAIGGPVALTPGANNTATAQSPPFSPSATGAWCFAGYYGGDATYNGSQDTSAVECFMVTQITSSAASVPGHGTLGVGQTNFDTVTVSGNATGGAPTGNVTFYECGPGVTSCSAATGTQVGSPVALAAGANNTSSAQSGTFTPNTPGTWCFAAAYAGSTKYTPSQDSSSAECFTVAAVALSGFTTTPSGATVGSAATDAATVTGNATNGSPTGTITFYECGPGATACSSAGTQIGSPVSVAPGANNTAMAASPPWTPGAPGTYCYAAVFTPAAGGAYLGATDTDHTECFSVGQVALTKTSKPQGTVSAGQTITYTLGATDNGGAPTSGTLVVTDNIPAGTSYVAGSASCNGASGCTATEAAGVVTFTITSLGAGATDSLTFAVTVNSGVTGTVTNSATFSGPNCTPGIAPCVSPPATNPVAAVAVTKTSSAGTGQISTGQTFSYTLAAASIGTAAASAVITDGAPAGTTYVVGSAMCPTNSSSSTCSVSYSAATGVITWTLTGVPAGTTYSLTFSVTVNAGDANGASVANTGLWSGQGCVPGSGATTCPTNTVMNTVMGAAPVVPPAVPAPIPPQLAATGAPVTSEFFAGLLLVSAGAGLLLFGRLGRRRRARA
jgi:uncharacterized repeat protein (TIGR01451 family)